MFSRRASASSRASRGSRRCTGGRAARERLRELSEDRDRDGDRTERDEPVRIDRNGLVRGDALPRDVRAARRSHVDDLHPIHHHGGMRRAHRRARDDERCSRRFTSDDEVTRRRARLPLRHRHEDDRGVRERKGRLPERELRSEVERDRLIRGDRSTVRERRSLPVVEERELIALLDDPRVLRRDALQNDVVARCAADGDLFLAEPGDHRGAHPNPLRSVLCVDSPACHDGQREGCRSVSRRRWIAVVLSSTLALAMACGLSSVGIAPGNVDGDGAVTGEGGGPDRSTSDGGDAPIDVVTRVPDVLTCPMGICNGGCDGGTCTIDCSTGCAGNNVNCPAGFACNVRCTSVRSMLAEDHHLSLDGRVQGRLPREQRLSEHHRDVRRRSVPDRVWRRALECLQRHDGERRRDESVLPRVQRPRRRPGLQQPHVQRSEWDLQEVLQRR